MFVSAAEHNDVPQERCKAFRLSIYAIKSVDETTNDLHLHLAALRVPEDIGMFYRHLGCKDSQVGQSMASTDNLA